MATKKQIILPFIVITIAIAAMIGLKSLKKPPQTKPAVTVIPVVDVVTITLSDIRLLVKSQGIVEPKDQTTLTAQVTGQIIELSASFIKGALVKSGAVLARIDPSDYQADLIAAQANLATAKASLQQEKAKGQVAEEEWKKISNSKPSQLGLRKPQLAKELASVRAAQAAVQKANRNLERTYIKAPYDAIVASRAISLGSVVTSGVITGELLATSIAQIRLPIADQDLAFLPSDGVGVAVEVVSNFKGVLTSWPGKIVRNEGIIDTNTRMSYLVAEVVTPYQLSKPLRFGSYVSVKISGHLVKQTATVPSHLVSNQKIALFKNNETLHYQEISIIQQQGDTVVISGIEEGARYISSALDYPTQGMAITLASDSNQEQLALVTGADNE
jgi:RND family efflux transporter MFP subunit